MTIHNPVVPGVFWCSECVAGLIAGHTNPLAAGIVMWNGAAFCEHHYMKMRGLSHVDRTVDRNGVVHRHAPDEEVVVDEDGRATLRRK